GFVIAAGVYTLTIYDARDYGNQFRFAPGTYIQHAIYYFRSPASLWSGAPTLFRYPVTLLALVLVALEVISQVIRRPSVTEWYFLLSWIIVIFYSSGQTDRYLLPAYPLFCIYLV